MRFGTQKFVVVVVVVVVVIAVWVNKFAVRENKI